MLAFLHSQSGNIATSAFGKHSGRHPLATATRALTVKVDIVNKAGEAAVHGLRRRRRRRRFLGQDGGGLGGSRHHPVDDHGDYRPPSLSPVEEEEEKEKKREGEWREKNKDVNCARKSRKVKKEKSKQVPKPSHEIPIKFQLKPQAAESPPI